MTNSWPRHDKLLERHAKVPKKSWKIYDKAIRKSWESHEKFMRKSWTSHKKVIRNSWKIPVNVMRKAWEIHEKVMRKSRTSKETGMSKSWESYKEVMISFICRHVCSRLFSEMIPNSLTGWPHDHGMPFRQRQGKITWNSEPFEFHL